MRLDAAIAAAIEKDGGLLRDFDALCDCGGRLSGTPGEADAVAYVAAALRAGAGAEPRCEPVSYMGWRALHASLRLDDGSELDCHPLLRSVATRGPLEAEVVDLGRGTPDDFAAQAEALPGRIALVRHEYMFSAGTVHRMVKYRLALERGAVGFLIAGPTDGLVVAGSTGRGCEAGIPALGIDPRAAGRLAGTAAGRPVVTLHLETEEAPSEAQNPVVDLAGRTEGQVVLCAHVDGHDVGESAMDNASGVAVLLGVVRALAPVVGRLERGLRVMVFNVEEWALTGSARHVASLDEAERARVALTVNLDSVAGSDALTALTSGFPAMDGFVRAVAEANGEALSTHLPFMRNSDHANFALAGIPAFRLVAGFDDPASNLRHVLTPADTRDKVTPGQLRRAAHLAAAIVVAACSAGADEAARWREGGPTGE